MIRFAKRADVPFLKALWSEAFEDDDSSINFFYEHRFTESNTLIWAEKEMPIAMLTLLPAQMKVQEKRYPVKYVYGVATKREYRGRGISSKLISYINKQADDNNEILVLVPAKESLFDFYKRFGYQKSFYLKKYSFPVQELSSVKVNYEITPVNPDEYKNIRDLRFQVDGYILWDRDALTYVLHENALLGGTTVIIRHNHIEDILMYYTKDKALYVKETSLSKDVLALALSDIALKAGCNTVHARLPQGSEMEVPSSPFGMAYTKTTLDIPNAYLNLVLD